MKKPLFKNESEAREFFYDVIWGNTDGISLFGEDTKRQIWQRIKLHGYIRISIVEEAEELYKEMITEQSVNWTTLRRLVGIQHEAILELKKQIEVSE